MNSHELKINESSVKDLNTDTGKATLEALSSRFRSRNYLDLLKLKRELLKQGKVVDEDDFKGFWTALQDTGAGTLIRARGSRPPRFKWDYNMRKVAADILAMTPGVRIDLKTEKRAPRRKKSKGAAPSPVRNGVVAQVVIIPLRADFNVELRIPHDMSKNELKVIQDTLVKLIG